MARHRFSRCLGAKRASWRWATDLRLRWAVGTWPFGDAPLGNWGPFLLRQREEAEVDPLQSKIGLLRLGRAEVAPDLLLRRALPDVGVVRVPLRVAIHEDAVGAAGVPP